MKPYTLEQQMARFGIPETEQGPYVTELRKYIQKKLDNGLIYMSGGTWEPDFLKTATHEEFAKKYLAFNWTIDNYWVTPVTCIDKPIYWSYDFSKGFKNRKKKLVIKWKNLFSYYVVDNFYSIRSKIANWYIKNVLKRRNPYT